MTTVKAIVGLRAIALEDIKLSTSGSQAERRKHFDKAAMAELASSIKAHGVLVPVIARPVNGHFELVAGERRYLAAKTAGVGAINTDVRELTDEQVLEIQLIENLQREGLHELAEAEGYEQLHKLGHSADEIADKVGKSKAYVYGRMKLLALGKGGRAAFYEGKISASIALLLARIPVESLQKEALKEILEDPYDGPMSYRQAAELVQQDYMQRLDSAGFPTEDATLVPAAGACGACPKRTGNQPELFGDIKRADVCTDTVCFRLKREAHAAREIARAKETGRQVIDGKQAKTILPYGADSSPRGAYHKLDERCYEDPKNRTVRQLLGKDFEPVLVKDPDSGVLVPLAPAADVKKALKDAGVKARPEPANPQSAQEKKAKAEKKFRRALFDKVRENYPASLGREDWNALAIAMVHEMQQETCRQLFAVWGWEPKKERYGGGDYRKAAAELIPKLSGPDISKFFLDCTIVADLQVFTWSQDKPTALLAAAKRFKVNVEAVKRQLNAAEIPKAKKAKGKGK
jgi:ParB/RepB/Spo0J family partition protein